MQSENNQNPTMDAVMRPLELLRINIQSAFDRDVDAIVRKFLELYFKPALKNIKESLGRTNVPDDVLQKISYALLENAKTQYCKKYVDVGTMKSEGDECEVEEPKSQIIVRAEKRSASETNGSSSSSCITTIEVPPKKCMQLSPSSSTVVVQSTGQIQNPPQQKQPATLAAPRYKQIFWNTSIISVDTNFVLDVQVNQAFGLGTDGKERLATKHPELIRYLPDEQDLNWMIEQKMIAKQNRHSRFLFLIYDEIVTLSHTETYKLKPNINLSILQPFKVPMFTIEKMKKFFVELNLSSKGLITTSYSTVSGISHLRNALLQGSYTSSTVASSTTSFTIPSAGILSLSSLPSSSSLVATSISSTLPTSTILPTTLTLSASQIQNKISNPTVSIPTVIINTASVSTTTTDLKPKSSLSSSHATLTALLNSNSDTLMKNKRNIISITTAPVNTTIIKDKIPNEKKTDITREVTTTTTPKYTTVFDNTRDILLASTKDILISNNNNTKINTLLVKNPEPETNLFSCDDDLTFTTNDNDSPNPSVINTNCSNNNNNNNATNSIDIDSNSKFSLSNTNHYTILNDCGDTPFQNSSFILLNSSNDTLLNVSNDTIIENNVIYSFLDNTTGDVLIDNSDNDFPNVPTNTTNDVITTTTTNNTNSSNSNNSNNNNNNENNNNTNTNNNNCNNNNNNTNTVTVNVNNIDESSIIDSINDASTSAAVSNTNNSDNNDSNNNNNDIFLNSNTYTLLSDNNDILLNNSGDILNLTDFVNFNDVNVSF